MHAYLYLIWHSFYRWNCFALFFGIVNFDCYMYFNYSEISTSLIPSQCLQWQEHFTRNGFTSWREVLHRRRSGGYFSFFWYVLILLSNASECLQHEPREWPIAMGVFFQFRYTSILRKAVRENYFSIVENSPSHLLRINFPFFFLVKRTT